MKFQHLGKSFSAFERLFNTKKVESTKPSKGHRQVNFSSIFPEIEVICSLFIS